MPLSIISNTLLICCIIFGIVESLNGRTLSAARNARIGFARLWRVLCVQSVIACAMESAHGISVLTELDPFATHAIDEYLIGIVGATINLSIIAVTIIVYGLGAVVAVTEESNLAECLRRSAYLTRGSRWAIATIQFLVISVMTTILFVAIHPMYGDTPASSAAIQREHSLKNYVYDGVFVAFWAPLECAIFAVVYYNLQTAKDGVGVPLK
ncbi:MAG: hypothetical protein HY286_14290 [Planctomycetes bacterium]|nr:hypothetical protein [Planctomycetota bacterium]